MSVARRLLRRIFSELFVRTFFANLIICLSSLPLARTLSPSLSLSLLTQQSLMKNSFDSQILGRHAAPIERAGGRRARASVCSFVRRTPIAPSFLARATTTATATKTVAAPQTRNILACAGWSRSNLHLSAPLRLRHRRLSFCGHGPLSEDNRRGGRKKGDPPERE